ncbi:MAG TPA: molybdopterin cofactor-binding domain-containing protein [Acidiferrobacterales bacterium]
MITLTVNGAPVEIAADPAMPLLWALRDRLGLKGTKYGCGVGVCGICTVLIDGAPNHACMLPLERAAGRAVLTVEGLAVHHPELVAAWIAEQVPQCGYCQPGQLLAACALLARTPRPDTAAVDAAMSGVLCRCGTYPRIRRAIARVARGDAPTPAGAPLAPAADGVVMSDFIAIHADDTITLTINHSEMGQGALTALAMLAAEELDVAVGRVRTRFAPVAPIYKNPLWGAQFTGGSSTVRGEWEPFRRHAAATRVRLLAAAAKRWRVPAGECATGDGAVVHTASGRRAGYGALAAAARRIAAPEPVALKEPADFRLIGHDTPRLEIPDMVAGRTVYGVDVARPDMLVASVARCPDFGGKLRSFDAAAARRVPGVRDVVPIDSGVAVVADDFWSALRGRAALTVEWQAGPHADLDNAALAADLEAALDRDGEVKRNDGDARRALRGAARVIEARYATPYLAHATLEPMNCAAEVRADACHVWVGTQSQVDTQKIAARLAGLPKSKVQVHTQFLGGGFGRRLETDFVADAVELAKRLGRPVQVVWTRADDLQHDKYRPAHAARVRASLGADGLPVAWFLRIAGPELALDGIDLPYAIPNLREEHVEVPTPVPTGAWRSVGASNNAFVVESFIDELALAAGRDPFEYRRALLAQAPRHRAVLERAAGAAGWGIPLPPGVGRGIAVYRSFGSWVAQVAEVALHGDTLRVPHVVCAIDCGIAVNPDAVRAQIEGGIAFGLSAALREEVGIAGGRVLPESLADYPILTLAEMPEVEVHIMESREPPGGVGEPGVPVIAPAVANAVAAAGGRRLRRLPLLGDGNIP